MIVFDIVVDYHMHFILIKVLFTLKQDAMTKKILLILLKLRYGQFRFAILISTLLLTFSVSGQLAGDIDTNFSI